MVADSTVGGNDKTHLSSLSSLSLSSSSSLTSASSLSSSSSLSSASSLSSSSSLSSASSLSSSSSLSSASSLSSSSSLLSSLSSSLAGHELAVSPPPSELEQRAIPSPTLKSPSVYSTHFPTFPCQEDCNIITDTASKLERSSFYWGPLGVEDAHRMLQDSPLGSFLIRDSRQKDVFFTLSYHSKSGPVSVRIIYNQRKFSLAGNERCFPTLFALLEYYVSSPKKSLSFPYRKWQPTLQERCRKRVMELCSGVSRISELPITHVAQDFLLEFPYKL